MELKVATHPQSPDGSLYAALPAPVCASLADRSIFFGALQIARRRHPPFFVGWSGGASAAGTIELDETVADLQKLPQNASVQVTLASAIDNSNVPLHLVADSVTLVPFYEGGFEEQAETFAAMSAAGSVLEFGLMRQIRVVHKGLCFPISLPGNRAVNVRVESVSELETSESSESPFVVLVNDSRVVVAPPSAVHPKARELSLNATLRTLPVPGELQIALPTYAFVSPAFESIVRSREAGFVCVYVSVENNSEVGRALSLPVTVCVHDSVPADHVFLPAFVSNALSIPTLTPVRLEESSDHFRPAAGFRIASRAMEWTVTEGDEASTIGDVGDLHYLHLPTFLFSGADLGKVQVENPGNEPENSWQSLPRLTEAWDREWTDEKPGKDRASETGNANAQGRTLLKSLPAWYLTPDLLVRGNEMNAGNPDEAAGISETQDAECTHLSKVPGEFARSAILKVLVVAQRLFVPSKPEPQMSLLLLEGAQGSGKTLILRRAAALLRRTAKVRTVWIRCQYHKGEPEQASLQRMTKAFKAASHGGPGVIVFDDADYFFSSGETSRQMGMNPEPAGVASKRKLAQKLVERIQSHRLLGGDNVLVLIACLKAEHVDVSLRSPALSPNFVKVDPPDAPDRAAILAFQLFGYEGVPLESSSKEEDGSNQLELLTEIARSTDGFCPQDLAVLVQRSRVALRVKAGSEIESRVDSHQLLSEMVELSSKMIPATRKGIKFDAASEAETISWDCIGGLQDAKSIIKETLELPLRHPDLFAQAPIRQKKGILLYGPAGCGKSILASAAAHACGMRKIVIRGPELLRKYIGESEAEVRRLFERAAAIRPCVIIFDEFDALAPRRGGESTGVADRVVNTLLTALDGVEELAHGIFIIATSSRPETIDPALLRPGRLDLWVAVDLPEDASQRLDILTAIDRSCGSGLKEDVLRSIAERTEGYSGADLQGVLIEFQLAVGRLRKTPDEAVGDIEEKAFVVAMSETRPSISAVERKRYARVMAQFDRTKRQPAEEDSSAPLQETLRRVALK